MSNESTRTVMRRTRPVQQKTEWTHSAFKGDEKTEKGISSLGDLEWVRLEERPMSPNGRTPRLRLVDLFCGCGGMTLGAWEAGRLSDRQLDIRLAADVSREALAVYRLNFHADRDRVLQEDVSRIFAGSLGAPITDFEARWKERIKSVDLIVAGPPCQGHSDLNNSTRRRDGRNELYLRVVRAAEVLRPRAVIVENVPAVLLDKRKVVERAIDWFLKSGYQVSHGVVHLIRFAIPQLRKRHVLVAVSKGRFDLSDLDDMVGSTPTVGDYLAGLEDEPETRDGTFYQPANLTEENSRRLNYLFTHGIYELPNSMRPDCHRKKRHEYISMYGRLHWDRPAQTITSGFGSMGQGRYVHPNRRRLLTPHEAARLQGFPDFFDFSPVEFKEHLKEMIANAVPPQFVAVLVTRLIGLRLL